MNEEVFASEEAEIKDAYREIEGYKVHVRSYDITRKINFFLTAACAFGIFYDESVNQWWLNQYIIAGLIFGLISYFSHKKCGKTSQLMIEKKYRANQLRSKIDQSKEHSD